MHCLFIKLKRCWIIVLRLLTAQRYRCADQEVLEVIEACVIQDIKGSLASTIRQFWHRMELHFTCTDLKWVVNTMLRNMLLINETRYSIYVDATYILHPWLQTVFPRIGVAINELESNTAMLSIKRLLNSLRKASNSYGPCRTSSALRKCVKHQLLSSTILQL